MQEATTPMPVSPKRRRAHCPVDMSTDGSRRPWTTDELDRLKQLVQHGWSTRRIAAVLNRTIEAVYFQARRYGGIDHLRHGLFAVRSGRELAQLLGVGYRMVARWIASGLLRAHRNHARRAGSGRAWLICDDALLDFLNERRAWMGWSPEQIRDQDWRHAAQAAREATPGNWHEMMHAARILGRCVATLRRYVEQGLLDAQRLAGQVYVWIPARPAATAQRERQALLQRARALLRERQETAQPI